MKFKFYISAAEKIDDNLDYYFGLFLKVLCNQLYTQIVLTVALNNWFLKI